MPYVGKSKIFSAKSCKQIKDLSKGCSNTGDGVYWVLNKQVKSFACYIMHVIHVLKC